MLSVDGDDFTLPSPFDVTVPVNSLSGSSQCANITFVDDDIIEGDHSFTVSISDPGGAETVDPTVATVTIDDNDGTYSIGRERSILLTLV